MMFCAFIPGHSGHVMVCVVNVVHLVQSANGIAGQRHTDVDGFAVTAGQGFGDGHGVITGYRVTVGHLVTGHTVGDGHEMGLGHVQVVVG